MSVRFIMMLIVLGTLNLSPNKASADMTAGEIYTACSTRDQGRGGAIGTIVFTGGEQQVAASGHIIILTPPTGIEIMIGEDRYPLESSVEAIQTLAQNILMASNGINHAYAVNFFGKSIDLVIAISGSDPYCERYSIATDYEEPS